MASSQLQTDVAFVAIVILAAIGMGLFSLVGVVERVTLPWVQHHADEGVGVLV
jgi:ABC-type nitrate/sulfonate/bicarbonate transport system permease component